MLAIGYVGYVGDVGYAGYVGYVGYDGAPAEPPSALSLDACHRRLPPLPHKPVRSLDLVRVLRARCGQPATQPYLLPYRLRSNAGRVRLYKTYGEREHRERCKYIYIYMVSLVRTRA